MMHLTCNKTKLIQLCREFGLTPQKTKFTKAYRERSWWLEWTDEGYFFSATFSTAAGKPFLGIRRSWYDEINGVYKETWDAKTIPLDQLTRLSMIETVAEKGGSL